MSLMQELNDKALRLGVPLSAHLDITYRCNERCEHCYLDHDDHGEMTTAEIKDVLHQLADAGVFFLTLSGGEPLMRRDCFEIIEYARSLAFNVKLKTNAVLIREKEAQRLRALGVEQVQISVYSHRPEVHDAITKLPGSLKRTLAAIRLLRSQGLRVTMANVLMRSNRGDTEGVHALAAELGAHYTLDPTITPMMDGNTSVLSPPRGCERSCSSYFHNPDLVGDVESFCAPPDPGGRRCPRRPALQRGTHLLLHLALRRRLSLRAISSDVRQCPAAEVSGHLAAFAATQRSSLDPPKHLTTCSSCTHAGSCTRCPGLAYMEGNMRGPSTADCEKSFVRTGIVTAGMMAREARSAGASGLVQIEL